MNNIKNNKNTNLTNRLILIILSANASGFWFLRMGIRDLCHKGSYCSFEVFSLETRLFEGTKSPRLAPKNQKTVDISRKTNECAWEKWKCFDIIKYCDTYLAPNLLTAAQPKQNENHYRNSSLLTEGLISSACNCAKCTIVGEMTWRRNERGSSWLKHLHSMLQRFTV